MTESPPTASLLPTQWPLRVALARSVATYQHTVVVPPHSADMCQPETPALQRPPALINILALLVDPVCFKQFHRHHGDNRHYRGTTTAVLHSGASRCNKKRGRIPRNEKGWHERGNAACPEGRHRKKKPSRFELKNVGQHRKVYACTDRRPLSPNVTKSRTMT